ncbi:hypothetical protein CPB83DRAFT_855674 [Crepidotus variabilis]|uniref:Uncharacterized protein n=1 Tax=Crepidotus variabilis TaxID=179855 RepID=A0A9P6JPH7_9AGAR|nr:hypothetical protein CPB83DRAFT_855674 [Crepidotus variabilis]
MSFNICSGVSSNRKIEVFVSKFTINLDDSWFHLAPNFDDPTKSQWKRNGWEVIVFKEGNVHRGWYLDCANQIVNITFYGFSQDLGVVRESPRRLSSLAEVDSSEEDSRLVDPSKPVEPSHPEGASDPAEKYEFGVSYSPSPFPENIP